MRTGKPIQKYSILPDLECSLNNFKSSLDIPCEWKKKILAKEDHMSNLQNSIKRLAVISGGGESNARGRNHKTSKYAVDSDGYNSQLSPKQILSKELFEKLQDKNTLNLKK